MLDNINSNLKSIVFVVRIWGISKSIALVNHNEHNLGAWDGYQAKTCSPFLQGVYGPFQSYSNRLDEILPMSCFLALDVGLKYKLQSTSKTDHIPVFLPQILCAQRSAPTDSYFGSSCCTGIPHAGSLSLQTACQPCDVRRREHP